MKLHSVLLFVEVDGGAGFDDLAGDGCGDYAIVSALDVVRGVLHAAEGANAAAPALFCSDY